MGSLDFMRLTRSSSKDIENISPIKMEEAMNKNTREELIKQIKDAGQEIINHAETMVGEDCDSIIDFDIWINLKNRNGDAPSICWTAKLAHK